jgi:enamine deaminase RidA (YjgF/YER057c/UK114 family)
MNGKVEARLASLGVTLPEAPNPVANYVPSLLSGNLLFISGQISKGADGNLIKGRLGAELTVEQGREAARASALAILAQAKAALGELDRIAQVVRLTGFVAATPDFVEHPQVINGASTSWWRCWARPAATRASPSEWPACPWAAPSRSTRS